MSLSTVVIRADWSKVTRARSVADVFRPDELTISSQDDEALLALYGPGTWRTADVVDDATGYTEHSYISNVEAERRLASKGRPPTQTQTIRDGGAAVRMTKYYWVRYVVRATGRPGEKRFGSALERGMFLSEWGAHLEASEEWMVEEAEEANGEGNSDRP